MPPWPSRDSGTRLGSTSNKCVACGGDGQTYCYVDPNGVNPSQGDRCNAGTRFSSATGKCVACGNDGQTYCYVDPNGVNPSQGDRCNDGLRVVNGKCTP